MKTLSGLFCAAVILFADVPQSKAGGVSICGGVNNLVANCGFETGDFTGWTLTGNDTPGELGNLYGVEGQDPDGAFPHSGSSQAYFGDIVDNATTLSQTLSTVPGGKYTVSLYLAQDAAATGTCNAVACSNEFDVTLDGVSVFNNTDVPVGGYMLYTQTVKVTDPSSVFDIALGNDLGYFLLDDVSVILVPTPEPAAWKLAFSGVMLGGLFFVRRPQ
jgi:hypothetical protein